MGLRNVKAPEAYRGESLFRTMAMAMIIAAAMCFVAMFFPLYKNAPATAGVEYYLPWCLSYGIVNLLMAGCGVFFTTMSKEKPGLYLPGDIVGICFGVLLLGEAIPIGVVLGHIEFCISVVVIGVCLIAIGIVAISSLKEKKD